MEQPNRFVNSATTFPNVADGPATCEYAEFCGELCYGFQRRSAAPINEIGKALS